MSLRYSHELLLRFFLSCCQFHHLLESFVYWWNSHLTAHKDTLLPVQARVSFSFWKIHHLLFPLLKMEFSPPDSCFSCLFVFWRLSKRTSRKVSGAPGEFIIFLICSSSPGSYQRLDLFMKVLRVLCLNLTDAPEKELHHW